MSESEADPDFIANDAMPIYAFRYCLGRMTYAVGDCANWLIENWSKLHQHSRSIIARDLEEAFARDDADRKRGGKYLALGHDCDRANWLRVRALYRN